MPDITMCQDVECPKRKECYRYTAIPDNLMQSYFTVSPRITDCDYFMNNKNRRNLDKE